MTNLMLSFEILQSIAISHPDGFTVSTKDFQAITTGYAVAVAETQNSFDNYGLAKVVNYISNHPEINAVGGWMDSKTGLYYYDATIVVENLDDAILLGKKNGQIAIFDLNTMSEIRL